MRILIVNHYSGSSEQGMEYRHYYLAKEARLLGHDVSIVASRFSHLRITQPESRSKKWEDHCGISHLWLDGCQYEGNGAKRLFNMLQFATDLWQNASQIAREKKPDVVLASSPHPFTAYGAVKLARAAGAKFIFEIRDLWPLSLIALGSISPNHPVIRMLDHAEAYGCKHADHVISLLPCIQNYMEQRSVEPDKWTCIPNGILLNDWRQPWPELSRHARELLASLRERGRFIVGYAGSMCISDALGTILDVAELMRAEKVDFVLVGTGPEKLALQQQAQAKNLENVHFLDPVNRVEVPALLQWFDVAYIGWKSNPLYRFGIAPNKLMDYMMAGRPILHAVEAGNDSVSEARCGVSTRPEDPHSIAQGLDTLLRMSESERHALGNNGRDYVLRQHTYRDLAQRLLSICG